MSTAAELDGALLEEALRIVDNISNDVPISTVLTELQLVVERVTFSGLHLRTPQADAAAIAEIELLFRDEVSDGMVDFLRWMAERELLGAVADDAGRVFLEQCVQVYSKVDEYEFVTAVALSLEQKAAVLERLRTVHPAPARILFATSPSVAAGFTLSNGSRILADKSLRTHIAQTVPRSKAVRSLVEGGKS